MTINGRLLLLVVVTGLFVRVWMVNERPRVRGKSPAQACVTVRTPPPDPAPRAAAATAPFAEVAFQPTAPTLKLSPPLEEIWNRHNCPIPLPAGICGGVYRVVDDTGRVARLEIEPSMFVDLFGDAPTATADLLMTTCGPTRWYFIRQQPVVAPPLMAQAADDSVSESTPIPAETSATGNERPPCTNRKFDFTGYVPPDWTAAPDPEEIARPDPPDLPVPR